MGTAPRTSLLSAIVLLAWSATARAQDAAPVVREGKHFRIVVHPGTLPAESSGRLADEAASAVESTWPVLEKLLQVRTAKIAPIHLYCDESAYRAEEQAKRPVGFEVEGFTVSHGLESHVLLWPQLSPRLLGAIGLPTPTQQNLMLAAAWQVAAQQLDEEHQDPWLSELIAFAVLETVVNPKHAFGVDTAYDTRRGRVPGRPGAGEPPELWPIAALGEAKTRGAWEARTASLAVLAQYLCAIDAGWAKKMLAAMRKRTAGFAGKWRMEGLEAALGGESKRNDERLAKLCRSLRPVWRENVPMMVLEGKRWLCTGAAKRQAWIEAAAPPPAGDYAIRATVELDKGVDGQGLRFHVDATARDLLGVLFEPGRVALVHHDAATGTWTPQQQATAAIEAGKPVEVSVEVTKVLLRVVVGGAEAIAWPCKERGMHGVWGLGIGDSMAWIEGLRIEPLAKPKK